MTDISAPPAIAVRHFKPMPFTRPLRALGRSILALPRTVGRAFAMAYADPYIGADRRESVTPVGESNGRDPNW